MTILFEMVQQLDEKACTMPYEKVKYEPRSCEHCSKEFVPKRKDKRYCSRACQSYGSRIRTGKLARDLESLKKLKYNQKPYRIFLKDSCERCGFIPENVCQLDIHHLDGNHDNNVPENLKTLYANCHRLEHVRKLTLF